MNSSDIIYSALVLDEKSSDKLKEFIESFVNFSYDNIYCHHVTIKFGKHDLIPENLGKEFKIIPGYLYADEKCSCISLVKVPFHVENIPHITLACKEGVKPVYSNSLLKNSMPIKDVCFIGELTGKIGTFTKKGWIF